MSQPTGSFGPMSSGTQLGRTLCGRPHGRYRRLIHPLAILDRMRQRRCSLIGAAGMGDHVPGGTGRRQPGCRSNEQAHADSNEYTGYVRPKAARSWTTGMAPLISALRMASAGNCTRRAGHSRNWRLDIQFKVGTWKSAQPDKMNPTLSGTDQEVALWSVDRWKSDRDSSKWERRRLSTKWKP